MSKKIKEIIMQSLYLWIKKSGKFCIILWNGCQKMKNKNYKSESVFPFNCSLKKKITEEQWCIIVIMVVRLSQTQQNKDFNFKKDSQFSWS